MLFERVGAKTLNLPAVDAIVFYVQQPVYRRLEL